MTIEEIQAFLNENKDDAEVKAFLATISPEHELSAADVSEFLKTDDGKLIVQPQIDQAVTKAVKTRDKAHEVILENEVKKRVAAEVLKMNPSEEPWQKEIRELKESNEKERQERAKENMRRMMVEKAAKMQIDPFFIEDYLPESIEVGELFLKKIKEHEDEIINKKTNELLANGFKPKSGEESKNKKVNLSALTLEETIALEMAGELDKQL